MVLIGSLVSEYFAHHSISDEEGIFQNDECGHRDDKR